MRVLVTGATGFVGTTLVERLVARGDSIRALVRASSSTGHLSSLGVELFRGDVEDRASLARAVEGCELVVHLAGAIKALHPSDLFRANADGTRRVAAACAGASAPPRLIYVSSLAAAGPSEPGHPRREEDLPAPVSFYGESKLAGERAVREIADHVSVSIVRPPIVYGPRDRELVPQLLRMAKLGLILRTGFKQKRYSLVHVEDLCDGIIAVADRGERLQHVGSEGLYFLDGEGGDHSWDEIAKAACAAAGARACVVVVPESLGIAAATFTSIASTFTGKPGILSFDKLKEIRQPAWTCCADRARQQVGFSPRFTLAEGMADAVARHCA